MEKSKIQVVLEHPILELLLSDLDNEHTRKAFDRPTCPKSEKQQYPVKNPEKAHLALSIFLTRVRTPGT